MLQIGEYTSNVEYLFNLNLWPRNTQKCTNQECNIRKKLWCIFHHMDFTLTSLTIMQWYNDDSIFTKDKLIALVKVATSA
jgi:hypothetical protein